MERVLVTGGAGFIGSFVAKKLLDLGKDVIVLDDLSVGKKEYVPKNAKFIKGSILDKKLVDRLIKKTDSVYHLAVAGLQFSLEHPMETWEINATGTLNLLIAAKKYGKKVIYVSSSEVYGNAQYVPMDENHPLVPRTPYAASKLAGEKCSMSFFLTFNLPVIIVRPFNVFGPHAREDKYAPVITRFALDVLKNNPPTIFGNGEQTRDYTFVKDTARGIVLAGEEEKLIGDVINIGSGNEIKIKYIAEKIIEMLGKEIEPIFIEERKGDVSRMCADVRKAKKLLGFKPEYSFERGMEVYINWLKRKYS